METTFALDRIASYEGKQSPATYLKDCTEIVERGVKQCEEILAKGVAADEPTAKVLLNALEVGHRRLQFVAGQLEKEKAALHTPSGNELEEIQSEYERAKTEARAAVGENIPLTIRLVTKNITNLCAKAHLEALRVLPALRTLSNGRVSATKKAAPSTNGVTKKAPQPAAKPNDKDTGELQIAPILKPAMVPAKKETELATAPVATTEEGWPEPTEYEPIAKEDMDQFLKDAGLGNFGKDEVKK